MNSEAEQSENICFPEHEALLHITFLTSNNEFSGIIYSLFRGRQNIFLTIISTKFVINVQQKF